MKEQTEDQRTQVVRQMAELVDAIDRIEKGISRLRERLHSVLGTGVVVESNPAPKEKESEMVPLAEDIKNAKNQIGELNIEITDMLRLLELYGILQRIG